MRRNCDIIRDRKNGVSTFWRTDAASPVGNSVATTGLCRLPRVMVASLAARRFRTQLASPKVSNMKWRPSYSKETYRGSVSFAGLSPAHGEQGHGPNRKTHPDQA